MVGNIIRQVRNIKGIKQKELALKCGISPVFLNYIENGKRNPSYNSTHGLQWCTILMRKNKDYRHDTEVKPELLKNRGITPDDVAFILEDRNVMVQKWRELGFTCLQVAEGNF